MQREAKAYLWDIAHAAASVRTFTDGKDLEGYLNDEMLRAAVERKFGIVGEALSQLLRYFPDYSDRITLVSEIVAFRNQIVHGYATVRDDIVWEIVRTYLPRLHREVVVLLAEGDTQNSPS
ncbi:MAG TPA: HepT-like ribonuclease domain-containing protein [Terracidiphilus sp.]|nr:HepT-like ribonuclease domain-containing protein [Terracidiphilus sp.]